MFDEWIENVPVRSIDSDQQDFGLRRSGRSARTDQGTKGKGEQQELAE